MTAVIFVISITFGATTGFAYCFWKVNQFFGYVFVSCRLCLCNGNALIRRFDFGFLGDRNYKRLFVINDVQFQFS